MDKKLMTSALTKYLLGFVLLGEMIFLPAGTLKFAQGWLFMAVLFVPMLIMGVVMAVKSPELLRKRLNGKEEKGTQKAVVAASGLMFAAAFAAAGLSYRFGWLRLPMGASIAAAVVFLAG